MCIRELKASITYFLVDIFLQNSEYNIKQFIIIYLVQDSCRTRWSYIFRCAVKRTYNFLMVLHPIFGLDYIRSMQEFVTRPRPWNRILMRDTV